MQLILCSILICGCLNVIAAPAPEQDDGGISGRGLKIDSHECTGQYLKRKGKLSQDEETGNNWSMCVAFINTAVRVTREDYENKAKKFVPNELDCVMREFDKNEVTDFFMKGLYYHTFESLSAIEKATHMTNIANEAETLERTIATACAIDEEKFQTFLRSVFPPRSEKSETPVVTTDNA